MHFILYIEVVTCGSAALHHHTELGKDMTAGIRRSAYLPSMLTASVCKPCSDCTPMMVFTHSYKIALPAFLAVSVVVATCRRIVYIVHNTQQHKQIK